MKKTLMLMAVFIILLSACGGGSIKPKDVRNDETGKWKVATTSDDIDITEYAQEYKENHMKDNETHFIVNFTNNTTSILNESSGLLFVDVHERIDKEEHDAKVIGNGMLLKSYVIHPDGKIEEVE